MPGRKSDINHALWLQRLHACSSLRASVRPGHDIAVLRVYLRHRERLHLAVRVTEPWLHAVDAQHAIQRHRLPASAAALRIMQLKLRKQLRARHRSLHFRQNFFPPGLALFTGIFKFGKTGLG